MLYAVSATFLTMRWVDHLHIFRSMASILIALRSMATTIINYGIILAFLAVAFGVGFSVLLPEGAFQESDTKLIFTRPLFTPLWSMFGDFDHAKFEENLAPSTLLQIIGPTMLSLSMFVLSVVFLNLMIAQMGSDFDNAKASNDQEFARLYFERVTFFKDMKGALPPPLNILLILWHCYKGIFRGCLSRNHHDEPDLAGFAESTLLSSCTTVSKDECSARDLCAAQKQRQRRAEEHGIAAIEGIQTSVQEMHDQLQALKKSLYTQTQSLKESLDSVHGSMRHMRQL